MEINTKNKKRVRRYDKCKWCSYPIMFCGRDGRFHDQCVPQPDYHDVQGYWDWQKAVIKFRPRTLTYEEAEDWANRAPNHLGWFEPGD